MMAVPRAKLVDPQLTCWYHCISKCVRGELLLDRVRKQWIQDRLEELVGIFAIEVAGFSVLDNHFHLLLHLNPKAPERWSKADVLRRWAQLHPPRDARRRPLQRLERWIREKESDDRFVDTVRKRLVDLGWFMKSLKEPLSRLANQQDKKEGTFWSARYQSIAVLDEAALLATCIYIDLNPLAAGLVPSPEQALFTSLALRLAPARQEGRLEDLRSAQISTAAGLRRSRGLEKGLWLCPLEDRREQGAEKSGLLAGLSLGSYLMLLDETSRLLRPGKARVNPAADPLLDRLGTTRQAWEKTFQCLFSRETPRGVAFAFDRSKLREAARRRGCRHLANLNGCPT
jgi:REP element-mobilizing transposase RayT